ncbi:MAG: ATP-binding protein [Anaerolineae bacterium]
MSKSASGPLAGQSWPDRLTRRLRSSIRNKIIFPYFVLTLAVAMAGAYVVTNLVQDSLEERIETRLIDSGRAVSDAVVSQEVRRLEVERLLAFTEGVPQAISSGDYERLAQLVSPILANEQAIDSIILLDAGGREVLRTTRASLGGGAFEEEVGSLASFQSWPAVVKVLNGVTDNLGSKYTQLARLNDREQIILYTIGPVRQGDRLVGVILVGAFLDNILADLKRSSQADVTLYDSTGLVIGTTFGGGQEGVMALLKITPQLYAEVLDDAQSSTALDRRELFGRSYWLAYGPFVLRGETLGVFSVGWPGDFVVRAGTTSRNLFTAIFFLAMVAVISIGLLVAQQILQPIAKLVSTTQEIARGNLARRTGVSSPDEIGRLATTFDEMTRELELRTQDLEILLQLQEEEARKVQAILSSIADGVIVQNRRGEVITTNPAARRILDLLAAESSQAALESLPFSQEDILSGRGLTEARRFQIAEFTFSALAAPVVNAEQEVLGTVVVLRDITREVESDNLKNQFIESISHELLTPLVPIQGSADLLLMQSGDRLDDQQIRLVNTVRTHVQELHEMISTLIDISQIEGNSLGLEEEELRLETLVSEAYTAWLPRAGERGLSFTLKPATDAPLWVLADQARLRRALNYLLDNAFNYTTDGGQVELQVTAEDGEVRVDVRDTGVGIDRADQPFIFQRFFRAVHGEVYGVRGAGLGLYLARAIIEQHGGRIWFESEKDRGSTFSFALPLETASATPVVEADEMLPLGQEEV